MKIISQLLLLVLTSTILFGCNGDVQVEGYILQVEPNSVLVVENIEQSNFDSIATKSFDELMSENIFLTYYSYEDTKSLQKGDKVKIWTSGDAMTSYPAQADATKIKIIEQD